MHHILYAVGTLVVSIGMIAGTAKAEPFPRIDARDLTGREATLPDAFAGERLLVLVGFEEAHQDEANAWSEALGLRDEGGIPSAGVGVVSPGFVLMQPMISRIVRGKVPDPETRERTYLSFSNRDEVAQALGQSSYDRNILAIVDGSGNVERVFVGTPTEEAILAVKDAFTDGD